MTSTAIRAVMTYCELPQPLEESLAHFRFRFPHRRDEFAYASANGFAQALALSRRVQTVFAEMLERCSLPSL